MQIAYAAHTSSCTFFLDDEGICRQIVRRAGAGAGSMSGVPARGEADTAGRCIGAQYVASLDAAKEGGLTALPTVGLPMLFAYVGDTGRIALVRTGPVSKFEQTAAYRQRAVTEPRADEPAATPARPESGIRARNIRHEDCASEVEAQADRSLEIELDLDLDELDGTAPTPKEEDEEANQRTRKFKRDMLVPFPPPPSRPAPRISSLPPAAIYTRNTPTPPVRHVTIVPPPASSAPTVIRHTTDAARDGAPRRRGILPVRSRA